MTMVPYICPVGQNTATTGAVRGHHRRRRSPASTPAIRNSSRADIDTAGAARLRGRPFVTDLDYTREELEDLLKLAVNLKEVWKKRPLTPFLPGKHLAMIFEAASTRTRVSFENGFAELGGNALYLRPGEIHLPGRETHRRHRAHTVAVRRRDRDPLQEERDGQRAGRAATVPVINGMDHDRHPCQTMSDAFTILETPGALAASRSPTWRRRPPLQLAGHDAHQARPERAHRQRRRLRDRPRADDGGALAAAERRLLPARPTTRSRPSTAPTSSTPTAGGGPARRRSTRTASRPSSRSR